MGCAAAVGGSRADGRTGLLKGPPSRKSPPLPAPSARSGRTGEVDRAAFFAMKTQWYADNHRDVSQGARGPGLSRGHGITPAN